MKKLNVLVLGLMVTIGVSSCIKDGETFDPAAQYQLEKPIIEEYAKANLSAPSFNESWGIWYEIIDPGEPGSYEYKVTSQGGLEFPTVTVKYTGQLLDGTVFDSRQEDEGVKLSLGGNIITAWPVAFFPQKIEDNDVNGLTVSGLQKGAKIRFVTPSRWAYANQSSGKIPANSPLDFEIEVLDIVPPSGSGN